MLLVLLLLLVTKKLSPILVNKNDVDFCLTVLFFRWKKWLFRLACPSCFQLISGFQCKVNLKHCLFISLTFNLHLF